VSLNLPMILSISLRCRSSLRCSGLVQSAGAVAAVGLLGDVQAVDHQLAVVLLDECAGQRRVASAQGLHLVSDQDDPGLVVLRIV
jgi:hypothetical protein